MWCHTDPERMNCYGRLKGSAATEDPNRTEGMSVVARFTQI